MGFDIEVNNTNKLDLSSFFKKDVQLKISGFSDKSKEVFYTEFAILLASGITIVQALELLLEDQKKEHSKKVIEALILGLVQGNSMYKSMSLDKKSFTNYEIVSFQIGEESGTLKLVSEKLGLYYKKRNLQKRNIKNALTYPLVVLLTALMSVYFMLQFVVPMFTDIFKQNSVKLPWVTQKIISLSLFFQKYTGVILLITIIVIVLYKLSALKWNLKRYEHEVILKVPFLGKFIKKIYLLQYVQAVSLLVNAQVSILKSVQLTQKMTPFFPLKKALSVMEKKLLSGEKLSVAMENLPVFDQRMIALIKVAEETNKNEYVYERLSDQYMTDLEQISKNLSNLLEPLIIIVLGVVVGVVLIAMYLPMFQLSTVLGGL